MSVFQEKEDCVQAHQNTTKIIGIQGQVLSTQGKADLMLANPP